MVNRAAESLNTILKLVHGLTAFVSTLEIPFLPDAEGRLGSRRPEKDHSAPVLKALPIWLLFDREECKMCLVLPLSLIPLGPKLYKKAALSIRLDTGH